MYNVHCIKVHSIKRALPPAARRHQSKIASEKLSYIIEFVMRMYS
jgi:hypothetical protein